MHVEMVIKYIISFISKEVTLAQRAREWAVAVAQ